MDLKKNTLEELSSKGDILSEKILNFLESLTSGGLPSASKTSKLPEGFKTRNQVLSESYLPYELAIRSVDLNTYVGYLNGEIPIVKKRYGVEEIFLPTRDREEFYNGKDGTIKVRNN